MKISQILIVILLTIISIFIYFCLLLDSIQNTTHAIERACIPHTNIDSIPNIKEIKFFNLLLTLQLPVLYELQIKVL